MGLFGKKNNWSGYDFTLRDGMKAEGHHGLAPTTRRGCVHDMFRGLLVEERGGRWSNDISKTSVLLKRLGFHVNSVEGREIDFKPEHLDPRKPSVSSELLLRRTHEYLMSLRDPSHASDLTRGSLLFEEAPSSEEYLRLIGHDFTFWLLFYVDEIARELKFKADNKVTLEIDSLRQVFSEVKDDLKPHVEQRFKDYVGYLKGNLGKPIDWSEVTETLTPYPEDLKDRLIFLQKKIGEILETGCLLELSQEVSSWIK
jgi:hypothetical protein